MSLSKSRHAYHDCYSIMDMALADEAGVRANLRTENAAIRFRMRCHQARQLMREHNKSIYPENHPMHGCCEYDVLVVRDPEMTDDGWWVKLEKVVLDIKAIETLSGKPLASPPDVALIEHAAESVDELEGLIADGDIEDDLTVNEEDEEEPMPTSVGLIRRF